MVRALSFCLFLSLLLWSPLTSAQGQSGPVATLEQQVHELVNTHRTAIGLEPLRYNDEVAAVARQHSQNMARGSVGHGHEGADERGRVLLGIIRYSEFGENVSGNNYDAASTARAAVTGWLNSPRHRANIEGTFDTTGIGIAHGGSTFFFTQIFLTTGGVSRSTGQPRRSRHETSEQDGALEPAHNQSSFRHQPVDVPSHQEERDPRRRAGRKRVPGGYVQDLEEGH